MEDVEIKALEKIKVLSYSLSVEFGVLVAFAFKLVGSDEEIAVSTIKLETILGVIEVAVNSQDDRYKHLVEEQLQRPSMDRKSTIITDD